MPKIKIYTTTTCPYCHMLKEYLNQKTIAYEEVNLDMHPEDVPKLVDTCGSMGVPCTHITTDDGKEESILGFNKARIDSLLGIS